MTIIHSSLHGGGGVGVVTKEQRRKRYDSRCWPEGASPRRPGQGKESKEGITKARKTVELLRFRHQGRYRHSSNTVVEKK